MNFGNSKVLKVAKNTFGVASSVAGTVGIFVPFAPPGSIQIAVLACVCASGLAAAGAGVVWAVGTAARRIEEQSAPVVATVREASTERDFRSIFEDATSRFGSKVSKVATIRAWSEKYPGCFGVVTVERQRGRRRIVDVDGYFTALPLSAHAAADIRAGRRSISEIPATELCAPGRQVSAIYVGAVAASSGEGKALAVQGLRSLVAKMADGRDCMVYTRPITADGLRLARHFNMTPVHTSEDDMGMVHAARVSRIIEGLRVKRRVARPSPP